MSLAALADQIGRYLCEKADLHSEAGKISYGVECVLVLTLSLATVLTIGGLVGVFGETAAIAGSLLVMKYIIGGPHLSGFIRCVAYSSVYIVGSALVLKTVQYIQFSTWVIGIISGAEILAVWLYVPLIRDGVELNREQISMRKNLAWFVLLGIAIFNVISTNYPWRGIFSGIFLAIFNVTPLGVGLVNFLESITAKKGDE